MLRFVYASGLPCCFVCHRAVVIIIIIDDFDLALVRSSS